jgi:hypothetical protein
MALHLENEEPYPRTQPDVSQGTPNRYHETKTARSPGSLGLLAVGPASLALDQHTCTEHHCEPGAAPGWPQRVSPGWNRRTTPTAWRRAKGAPQTSLLNRILGGMKRSRCHFKVKSWALQPAPAAHHCTIWRGGRAVLPGTLSKISRTPQPSNPSPKPSREAELTRGHWRCHRRGHSSPAENQLLANPFTLTLIR